jgi:hypothetical protein
MMTKHFPCSPVSLDSKQILKQLNIISHTLSLVSMTPSGDSISARRTCSKSTEQSIMWYSVLTSCSGGMQYHSWLWHYATSQRVMGLRPDEVNDFYQFTYALEFTQPLTKMSIRDKNKNISAA